MLITKEKLKPNPAGKPDIALKNIETPEKKQQILGRLKIAPLKKFEENQLQKMEKQQSLCAD